VPQFSRLPASVRAELRDFAELGHLQGLLRRLDELEVLHPELQQTLLALRALTSELRFDTLIAQMDKSLDAYAAAT
jgi:hypothetical protein